MGLGLDELEGCVTGARGFASAEPAALERLWRNRSARQGRPGSWSVRSLRATSGETPGRGDDQARRRDGVQSGDQIERN